MLTIESVTTEIKSLLGLPVVDVELEQVHYTAALSKALRLVNEFLPVERKTTLAGSAAIKRYSLGHLNGLSAVLDVEFMRFPKEIDIAVENPFLIYDLGGFVYDSTVGEYLAAIDYIDSSRQIIGADPAWEIQREFNATTKRYEYSLYVDLPESVGLTYQTGITYTIKVEPTDDPELGLPAIPPDLERWVVEYTLSECKMTLGRILRKYKGGPGPGTAEFQNDGEELVEDGKMERDDLKEDIKAKARQVPPLHG